MKDILKSQNLDNPNFSQSKESKLATDDSISLVFDDASQINNNERNFTAESFIIDNPFQDEMNFTSTTSEILKSKFLVKSINNHSPNIIPRLSKNEQFNTMESTHSKNQSNNKMIDVHTLSQEDFTEVIKSTRNMLIAENYNFKAETFNLSKKLQPTRVTNEDLNFCPERETSSKNKRISIQNRNNVSNTASKTVIKVDNYNKMSLLSQNRSKNKIESLDKLNTLENTDRNRFVSNRENHTDLKEKGSPRMLIMGTQDFDVRKSDQFGEKYLVSKGVSNFKHKPTKSEATNQISISNKNSAHSNSNFSSGLNNFNAKPKNFPVTSKAVTNQEILHQNLNQIGNTKSHMYPNNYASNIDMYENDQYSYDKKIQKGSFNNSQSTRIASDKVLQRVLPFQNQRPKKNSTIEKYDSEKNLRQKSGLRIRFQPSNNIKSTINSSKELINIKGIGGGLSLTNNLASQKQLQKKQNIENIYGGPQSSQYSNTNQKASAMSKNKSVRGISGNVQKT